MWNTYSISLFYSSSSASIGLLAATWDVSLRPRWLHSFFTLGNHKNHFLNKSTLNVCLLEKFSLSPGESSCVVAVWLTMEFCNFQTLDQTERLRLSVQSAAVLWLLSFLELHRNQLFFVFSGFAKTLRTRSLFETTAVLTNMQCALVKGEPNTNFMLLFNVRWLIFPSANESEMTSGSE